MRKKELLRFETVKSFAAIRAIYVCMLCSLLISCSGKLNRSTHAVENKLQQQKINFSGFTWLVSHSDKPAAPGPNFWDSENVWVDDSGRLHLRLKKSETTGLWSCAEIQTEQQLGLGKYEFFIEGTIDVLDKNVVFGLFNYSGTDGHDEIDIEFSKWGRGSGVNLHYSVWPRRGEHNATWSSAKEINLAGTYTTHRVTRSSAYVKFQGQHGFRNDDLYPVSEAVCKRKKFISSAPMPVFLNLWLFNGKAPSDGKEVEVIIHKFSFIPGN